MDVFNNYPYWGQKETNINIAYEEGKFNIIAQGILISVMQNINCDESIIRKAYNEFTNNREKYDVIRLKMILQEYESTIFGYNFDKSKKILIFTPKQKERIACQLVNDLKLILYRFFYEKDDIERMLEESNIYNLILKHPIKYYYMNIQEIIEYVKKFDSK